MRSGTCVREYVDISVRHLYAGGEIRYFSFQNDIRANETLRDAYQFIQKHTLERYQMSDFASPD